MKYLLDTHTLIWAILEPLRLSDKAKSLIEAPENHIMVSAITFWEISLKYSLGKLHLDNILPDDFPKICQEMNIETLPLDPSICAGYYQLSANYHKDPFDKMLIWIAKNQKLTIISKDESVKLYESEGVLVTW